MQQTHERLLEFLTDFHLTTIVIGAVQIISESMCMMVPGWLKLPAYHAKSVSTFHTFLNQCFVPAIIRRGGGGGKA